MEGIIELLKGFDLHTILSILAIVWFFNVRQEKKFDAKFDAMDKKFDKKFDAIDKKFDSITLELKEINDKLNEIDKRLSVVEKCLDWFHPAPRAHIEKIQNE